MLATAKDDTPAVRQVNLGIKHYSDTDGEGGNFACTPLKREELGGTVADIIRLPLCIITAYLSEVTSDDG